jgi:hypothetical protein
MIRVLRLIQYEYDDVEQMEADMARWQLPANGSYQVGANRRHRSATLPLEVLDADIIDFPLGKED